MRGGCIDCCDDSDDAAAADEVAVPDAKAVTVFAMLRACMKDIPKSVTACSAGTVLWWCPQLVLVRRPPVLLKASGCVSVGAIMLES